MTDDDIPPDVRDAAFFLQFYGSGDHDSDEFYRTNLDTCIAFLKSRDEGPSQRQGA
jgi:hypothetical protein